MEMPALPLGEIRITGWATKVMFDSNQSPSVFLVRYLRADWGDCSEEQSKANDAALEEDNRVQAIYHTANGEELWIITEWNRSKTTIQVAGEY
jgi:hypothetical protein